MQHISKAEKWAIELYPENKENCNYKLSDFVICHPYKDGYILFQSITWSLFFITENEFENIMSNKLLIESKVVIDSDIDEEEIADKAYEERSMIKNKKPYLFVDGFVILTTNTCNANCLYCFQNIKSGHMSIETAQKVVDFIKAKHKNVVKLNWFGGEPLKNIPVIDYITDKLAEENISFTSQMTTNSSLLTKDLFDKAVNKWNLKNIQVTIDGPEEYYNYIKNYDNIDGSPFQVVFNNLKDLLNETNIEISIRINVSHDNIDMLAGLIDYINAYFLDAKSNRFSIYFKLLYEIENDVELLKKDNLEEKFYDIINKYDNLDKYFLLKKHNLMHCMADRCGSIAITPNGKIYNCEHCEDNSEIGSLDEGIYKTERIIGTLNKLGPNLTKCKDFKCKLIPICEKCNFCPPEKRCQKQNKFEYENEFFLRKLEYTTDYYLKRINKNG